MIPLVTMPTTRPRPPGGAMIAAYATSTCVTTASTPTAAIAGSRIAALGASATQSRAITDSSDCPTISRRRSTRSPSGTTSSRPRP